MPASPDDARPIITLTTDFGLDDAYVGTMKGVLLSRCRDAHLVDLTHQVPAQDVRAGALQLYSAARYFPGNTVHLVVVDPGVGSRRQALAVRCRDQWFVGPDNGVLTLAAPPSSPGWRATSITNARHMLPQVSTTFHGRDIFAPVAAYLACGGSLDGLGEPISEIVELRLPSVRRDGAALVGEVIRVDRFGNLITNIGESDLVGIFSSLMIQGTTIRQLSTHYDPSFPFVALIGSDGWLEIAAPSGNAASLLGVTLETMVTVQFAP